MSTQALTLVDKPRWRQAAQALVNGCVDLPDSEQRVELMEKTCLQLGDSLYPAFLRVLALIGRYGDHAARIAVADGLVSALRTGRLPSGRIGTWGSAGAALPGQANPMPAAHSLGPVEYLCVWHAQPSVQPGGADVMDRALFAQVAPAILALIETAPNARQTYASLLLGVAQDPIAGALTRRTRQALGDLARAWQSGVGAQPASAAFLDALGEQGETTLAAMAAAYRPLG